MSGNGLRLVSFDCGGVRSLSQLKIMENIMHRIQYDLYRDDPEKIILPCECFDAMGGTDTGGLIVIMFCKLRLSVEQTTEEFYKICQEVYVHELSPDERTRRLQECLEDLLKRRGFPVDLKIGRDDRMADQGSPCFVVATPKASLDKRVKLRTYRTRLEPASKVTVVEAILATCATQPNFLPLVIGSTISRQYLVGGAMSVGNPCRELVTEAYDLFGRDSHISTILSLGSGHLGLVSAPSLATETEWAHALQNMANSCEQTAQDMKAQLGHLGIYYRFSVDHGLERTYGVEVENLGWINTQTQSYIQDVEVSRNIDYCVEGLRLRHGPVTLEQLKHTGGGQPVYKGMPPLTTYFVLRNQPWERMKDGLLSGDISNERQRILVISGMGGCGKTQLVLHFINEHRSKFKHAFFINGSSRENIQADIINHLRTASKAHTQASFSEALSFFCNPCNQPSLLIYDNVDNVNLELSSLLPDASSGSIIITTRSRSRGNLASPPDLHIELDVMSENEAMQVLLRSAKLEPIDEVSTVAMAIIEELGYLPVALVQAGSYIHHSSCTCDEYLSKLRLHKTTMMYKTTGGRNQHSTYAAFDISYDRMPVAARNILHLIGCLHFADFPMELIAVAAKGSFHIDPFQFEAHGPEFEESIQLLTTTFCPNGAWDELALDDIIVSLQDYSLASFTRSSTSLLMRMHPLMHEWARSRQTPEKQELFLRASHNKCCE